MTGIAVSDHCPLEVLIDNYLEERKLMINYVNVAEHHVALLDKNNRRKSEVLKLIDPLRKLVIRKDRLFKILYGLGLNDSEIEWLKHHGHISPVKDR